MGVQQVQVQQGNRLLYGACASGYVELGKANMSHMFQVGLDKDEKF